MRSCNRHAPTISDETTASGPSACGKAPFDRETARICYVLVRGDLALAQQAVQAVHAGMAAIARFGGLDADTRLALLCVPDAPELARWRERLVGRGIAHVVFHEPDHGIGASALATPPLTRQHGKVFSRLPLWGDPGAVGDSG